jgi:hypothetical protein
MEVIPYCDAKAGEWDSLVRRAGAPFLFERSYIEYHRDRFPDASVLIRDGGRLLALFPATVEGTVVYSHSGLTYGGLVHEHASATKVIEAFNALNEHYLGEGRTVCEYKPVPHIYASYPSQEDLYALFRLDARLQARAISSSIPLRSRLPFTESRKSGLRKGLRAGARVEESADFVGFWSLLESTLHARHGVRPVHSVDEIELLRSRFMDRIRLFVVKISAETLAGCVIYEVGPVAHVQYIASTPEGRNLGLPDVLFDHVIERYALDPHYAWFDFGTSSEQGGRLLNAGLIFQKEGFGGRGVVYDTYRYELSARIG